MTATSCGRSTRWAVAALAWITGAAALLLLAGCGSVSIYSETRDKQGQALKQAWQGVDLSTRFATSKANSNAVLEKEASVAERVALEKAQQELRAAVLGGTVKSSLVDPAHARLKGLVGDEALAQPWIDAIDTEQRARDDLDAAAGQLQVVGFELPSCQELAGPPTSEAMAPLVTASQAGTPRAGVVASVLAFAKGVCASGNVDATTRIRPAGEIGRSLAEAQRIAKEKDDLAARTRALRNEYRSALQAHEDALKKLREGGDARDALARAAKRLQDVIPKLEAAQDAFGRAFVAQEKLESISSVLASLADASKDGDTLKGDSKAAAALVFFSDWADATRKAIADSQAAALAPLLLERDLQKARLDAATREAGVIVARAANRQRKVDVQTQQVRELLTALGGLAQPPFQALTLRQALPPASDAKGEPALLDGRNSLLLGAAHYAYAEGRLQAEVRKLDVQYRALQHEEVISLAEGNVAQWSALIGGAVDQLADYGTTGIKAETVTALVNSLSLLWIGSGVNK